MPELVVDASVAVKWFLAEDRTQAALRVLEAGDLIAPATLPLEIFNAIWNSTRLGRLRAPVPAGLEAAIPKPFTRLVPIEELFAPAARLARSLSHPIYDCAYLALAEREGAPLVTADERLFAIARKARIKAKLL